MRVPADFSIDYDLYWEARGRHGGKTGESPSEWQRERAGLAARHIRKGSTVLDIGSGGGAVLEYLRDVCDIKPIGVDISEHSLQSLRAKNIEALNIDISLPGNAAQLPEVDYIIGFEILEHMANPEHLVHILSSKAREGMFFSFPNTGYYAHRLRLLLGRFPLQWAVHPGEHVRFWTVRDVLWWVPQIGLHLESLVVYQGLPFLKNLMPKLFGRGIFLYVRRT